MKILKDSFIYLTGELLAKALPFLLLPYLTRKLGVAGFGELSYYQTFFSLLLIVLGMSQDGAVARYYYVYGQRNLPRVVLAGYAYTTATALLGLALAWFAQSLVMAAVITAATSQAVLNVQLSLRQCRKQAIAYTAIQLAGALSTTALTLLLLEYTQGLAVEKRFAAIMLGNALVGLAAYGLFRQRHSQPVRLNRRLLTLAAAYMLGFGLPLILHNISGFMKGQLDRMLIFQWYPAAQLGVYSAGYQLAFGVGILLMAINKATVPYYYQALAKGTLNAQTIRRWVWSSLLFSPLPALLAYGLPESWFLWFLGQSYAGAHYYVCLFLLGFGLTVPYYLLVNYLFYHGKTKVISASSILSTLCYILVLLVAAQIGIRWAPLAMIAGNLLILPLLYRHVCPTP